MFHHKPVRERAIRSIMERTGGDAYEIHGLVEINPLDNLIGMAHVPMVRRPAASSGIVSWGNRINRR